MARHRPPRRIIEPKRPSRATDAHSYVVSWARTRFFREGAGFRPRMAIWRSGKLEEHLILDHVQDLGLVGVTQMAAVLSRTAEPDDIVAFAIRTEILGKPAVVSNVAKEKVKAAGVIARSRSGIRIFEAFQVGPGLPVTFREVGAEIGDAGVDFTAPDFFVDAALDDHLAQKGFPGARRRDAPEPDALTPEKLDAVELEDPTARLKHPVRGGLIPEMAPVIYATATTAPPIGLETRPLGDLLDHGWRDEGQALCLTLRLRTTWPLLPALDAFLSHPRLPDRAKLYALACACTASSHRVLAGDLGAAAETDVILERFANAMALQTAEVGGVVPWLLGRWPDGTELSDRVALFDVAVASASVAAALLRPALRLDAEVEPLYVHVEQATPAVHALRDALLDRLEVPPGTIDGRFGALVRTQFKLDWPDGAACDMERLREETGSDARRSSDADAIADIAAFHAISLHGLATAMAAYAGYAMARSRGDVTLTQPEALPSGGLPRWAAAYLARVILVKSKHAPEADCAALADRAATIAPWELDVLRYANELRFTLGVRTQRLLADLDREAERAPSLEVHATRFLVAQALGLDAALRANLRRALETAKGSPHAWMLRVLACLARPGERSQRDVLVTLLRGAAPEELDPEKNRIVHALYGPDPTARVTEVRQTLQAQLDALDETARTREERVLDLLTRPSAPRPERPTAPVEPGPDAVQEALVALRWRLNRPGAARFPNRKALHAHARAAERLSQHAEAVATEWLGVVGRAGSGLVASLDAALEVGDSSTLDAVLAKAECALGDALTTGWRQEAGSTLNALRPRLMERQHSELRARVDALYSEVLLAATDAEREVIDGRISNLCAEVLWSPSAGEAETGPVSPRSGHFLPMRLGRHAVQRSRDLGTAEWAIARGLRQVVMYNLAEGRRDAKTLHGTRDRGALCELRHHSTAQPVRVYYRVQTGGPCVLAIHAKQDDEEQRRVLERIDAWDDEAEGDESS